MLRGEVSDKKMLGIVSGNREELRRAHHDFSLIAFIGMSHAETLEGKVQVVARVTIWTTDESFSLGIINAAPQSARTSIEDTMDLRSISLPSPRRRYG